jgi:hypothetical protein
MIFQNRPAGATLLGRPAPQNTIVNLLPMQPAILKDFEGCFEGILKLRSNCNSTACEFLKDFSGVFFRSPALPALVCFVSCCMETPSHRSEARFQSISKLFKGNQGLNER